MEEKILQLLQLHQIQKLALDKHAKDNQEQFSDLKSDFDAKTEALEQDLRDTEQRINEEIETISLTPGAKGDTGEKGVRGDKGEKGDKGDTGKDGKDGKDGRDGKDGKDGIDGLDGLNGKDGKDGSPDTGEMIIKKINEQNEKIDYTKIKNLPPPRVEVREIRGGQIGTGIETIKQDGLTISNSTKSLNFKGATVTKQSDNVTVEIVGDTNDYKVDIQTQFNTDLNSAYMEITEYDGDNPTKIEYWEDDTKTKLIYTKNITYTSGNPTEVEVIDELNNKTFTTTIVYDGDDVESVTKIIT
jgi:hypothetical protein